jgi:hypothetical protein
MHQNMHLNTQRICETVPSENANGDVGISPSGLLHPNFAAAATGSQLRRS